MKILLLNPPYRVKINNKYERFFVRAGSRWPYSEYKKISEPSIYRPFPFFLAYTAALLKKYNYEVEVIDAVALQYTKEEFLDKLATKNSDFVVIEIAPFSINDDVYISKMLKMKNKTSVVVAVGPFVPLLINYIKEKNIFDYAINGEYEFAVVELIKCLEKNKVVDIKGVINLKKDNFELTYTELIEPLDKLPLPYREIFPSNENPNINLYWDVFCQLRPAVQMHTSRGCPYRCYFCLWNQVVYRNGKYRTFSVNRVVDEIEYIIKNFDTKEIYIDDDDFTINKNHVRGICEEIIRRKLNIKWSCMGDAINLDEELVYLMAKSGCIGIKFGVENAHYEVLKKINKTVNIQKVRNLVNWCKKFGIKTHATFCFGLLGETKDSMIQTLIFAKSLDVDSIQFSIATPYPGTEFYSFTVNNNYLKNFDWLNYDGSCKCVVNYPNLTNEEIEKFYNKAFKKWFLNKVVNLNWLLRQIRFFLRTVFSSDLKYTILFIKRLLRKVFNIL